MLKGIDIKQRIEYVSPSDTSEPKTVFVLRPLSSIEKLHHGNLTESKPIEAIEVYLTKSIVEVKNFQTADIKEVIESLPSDVMQELLVEINQINEFSKAESKNS